MAETPRSAKIKVNLDSPVVKRAIKDAEVYGFNEGLTQGRKEIIDWLERAYMSDPGRPDRGTPKAQALLTLASEASDYFRKLGKKGFRR